MKRTLELREKDNDIVPEPAAKRQARGDDEASSPEPDPQDQERILQALDNHYTVLKARWDAAVGDAHRLVTWLGAPSRENPPKQAISINPSVTQVRAISPHLPMCYKRAEEDTTVLMVLPTRTFHEASGYSLTLPIFSRWLANRGVDIVPALVVAHVYSEAFHATHGTWNFQQTTKLDDPLINALAAEALAASLPDDDEHRKELTSMSTLGNETPWRFLLASDIQLNVLAVERTADGISFSVICRGRDGLYLASRVKTDRAPFVAFA